MIGARDILDSPVWAHMIEELRKSYLGRFEATDPSDLETMRLLRLKLAAIADVEHDFRALAGDDNAR